MSLGPSQPCSPCTCSLPSLNMGAGRLLPSSEGDPHAKVLRLAGANSAALKRHFCALTCAFLAVLEPFCTPLGSSGPAAQAGPLQAFSHAEFLAELDRLAFPPSLQERFSSKVGPPRLGLSLHLGRFPWSNAA